MITLRSFPHSQAAHLALTVLRDHGIPCFLADENAHSYTAHPAFIPVRLVLEECYAEEARRLLDETFIELPDDAEFVEDEGQP